MNLKQTRALSALITIGVALFAATAAHGAGKPPTPEKSQKPPQAGQKTPRGACASRQIFAPWGDMNKYALMANGTFEKGRNGVVTKGGARVVTGNETFFAHSKSDRFSLALPMGSSVTLHAKCVAMLYPIVRFFVMNTGDPEAKLRVTVTYRDKRGVKRTVPLAEVTGESTWKPSPMMPFLNPKAALATQSNGNVWVTIKAIGSGGAFRIDDVFIDPYKLT